MVPKLISSTLKYFQYDTKNGLSLIDDHDTFLGSFPILTILRTLFFSYLTYQVKKKIK